MKHILLTPETAEKVRGKHGDHSYLEPYEVVNGKTTSIALPEAVLYDPEYSDVKEILSLYTVEDGWEVKQTEEI